MSAADRLDVEARLVPAPGASRRAGEAVPHLTVEGVSKSFDGVKVVDDVSFSVRQQEFVAVLGPSGSGKTTLFRCIAGLLQPDSGAIRINGDPIDRLQGRARRRLAVIFQQFNLVNRLTALENVLAGRLGHVPAWRGLVRRFTRQDQLLALECLERVGLLEHATRRADRLSGGQQQRVAIARALAQQPDLIIADEPVASLDPSAGKGVLNLLRGIVETEGVGVLCSLHQVHFARSYADRIVGLSRGRVIVEQPTDQFDEAAHERLYGPHTSD